MKLLVLAQTPPPLHGQSVMVRTLVEGLPAHGVALHHVNLRLSRDAADIGRARPGKILATLGAAVRATLARFRHGCDTLYYVPAPGKRGALWRDFAAMFVCRAFFSRLVLHFHNGGLADWLRDHATAPERALARLLLGRADLAIVLGANLRTDAEALCARQIAIVPNGIAEPTNAPTPRSPSSAPPNTPFRVLFLGLASTDKGVFAAAESVLAANAQTGRLAFQLTVAGDFPDEATELRWHALAMAHPDALRHAGFVSGEAKTQLFAESDVLFLPTHYTHEAQPLVLLEAMAHDLPLIATRWRGIPDLVPPGTPLIEPHNRAGLTAALLATRAMPPPVGHNRAHFLAHFTREQHLTALAAALSSLSQ